MGFDNLETALDEGQALNQITEEEVAFSDESIEDETALKLVIQDANTAEQYLGTKGLPAAWDTYDDLYRAYVRPRNWPNSDVARANLGMPLVLETMENLLPQIHMGFFSDPQPFLLEPSGKTTAEAARAQSSVLCWALKESGFKEQMRLIEKSILQYGFGVGKWGWKTETKKVKTYKRSASPKVVNAGPQSIDVPTEESDSVIPVVTPHEISKPTFEYVDLRNILVDPGCRTQDIRTAKYVIHQLFITADDLVSLREEDGYKNIPTREELSMILANKTEATTNTLQASQQVGYRENQAEKQTVATSVDPLSQPLEILEYTTADRVITVLQRKIVIRNEPNEFNRINYVSAAFIDVLGSMFGFGVTKLLEGEQRFEQGVVNSWIDGLSLSLNPAFHRKKGVGTQTQQISLSPGKVVNDDGELNPLGQTSISAEALGAIQTSEARAQRRVGANGGSEMPSQAMRTAEGVQAFSSGVAGRLQYFIETFTDLVFIPTLEAFIELCKDKLRPSQINTILNDEDGKAYEGDVLDMYNGSYSLDVLASTKLAARRAMAQLIPMFMQLFSAEPVQDSLTQQGKKVDYAELVQQAFDLTGWNANNIIVPMTPEDETRAQQMNNPMAAKLQMDAQKMQQKHADDLENIQAQGEAKAGVAVVKHVLQQSEKHDAAPSIATVESEALAHNERRGLEAQMPTQGVV